MNITIKHISFKSALTGQEVCGWLYTPNVPVRAVVQICHGMAEHMGRYHEFMRMLAQYGYAACGIDHLGHGRSAPPEDYGFFAEQDGWRALVENQHKFNKIIRSELPGCPIVLLGHSMGSFIARICVSRYRADADGLLLSGTASSGVKVDMAIQLANHSAQKNGARFLDERIDRIAFGLYNEPFRAESHRYAWLSGDRRIIDEYQDDPLCGFVFSASAFRDLFILMHNASRKKCFADTPKKLPILIFSGSLDPVGDRGKGPRKVYEQYVRAGVQDVELMLYEGGRHEMLFEVNREQVCEEVRSWLDDRFPPATAREETLYAPYEE